MKRSLQLLFLLLIGQLAMAQTWMPLGTGIHPQQNQIYNVQTTYYNGDLYVAEAETGSPGSIKLYKWDGSSWTTLPTLSISAAGYIVDLVGYQGSIYLIVRSGIHEFDGTSWSSVTLPASTNRLGKAEVINSKLVVSGYFNTSSTGNYVAAEYDGSSWSVMADLGYSGNLYGGNDVLEINT